MTTKDTPTKKVDEMTDLEFVDYWIDNSTFINPILFRELQDRGLYHITNYLSGDRTEQKAIARARMAKAGHYVGDHPELEAFAGHVNRIKFLQRKVSDCDPCDVQELVKFADDLKYHSQFVRDYLKPTIIP